MNKEEILNTFLLANIPEIITQEEFDDVKKAIKDLQQENQELKRQLHDASIQIQELIEKDIWCPSNCEKLEQLQQENQSLKKQLENKYSKTGILTNEVLYEENTKLINRQKEFIEWLEEKEKQFDVIGDPINSGACKGILRKYKEIIGVSDDNKTDV